MKKDKLIKYAHKLVIAISVLLLTAGVFQNSLWFDEAYTAGLMSHSFMDMMKWAASDVHPHLYYIMLKIFTLIFGTSCTAMRIFSVIGAVLFISVGYTHIRHDFGEKTGFWYSFAAAFMTTTFVYAMQIRMYTWAAYFVILAAVYAFRLCTGEDKLKTRVLFIISSVAAAYTHYFALFTVAAINISMLIYYIKKKEALKKWFITGAIQIASYIPGAIVLLIQTMNGGPAWITISYPDILFDLTSYHLLGEPLAEIISKSDYKYYLAGIIFTALYALAGLILYKVSRKSTKASDISEEKTKAAVRYGIGIYFGVILFSYLASFIIHVYYIRYTVVLGGLLVFLIAVTIATRRHIWQKIIAAVCIMLMCAFQVHSLYCVLYDPSANAVSEYLDSVIEEDDIFLFEDINPYVVSVQYASHPVYFYNKGHWGIHNAYRAFSPESHIVDNLEESDIKDYSGRIWVINEGECLSYVMSFEGSKIISRQRITTVYHNGNYELILVEKE